VMSTESDDDNAAECSHNDDQQITGMFGFSRCCIYLFELFPFVLCNLPPFYVQINTTVPYVSLQI